MNEPFVGELFYEDEIEKENDWCVVDVERSKIGISYIRLHSSGTYFVTIRWDKRAHFQYVGGDGGWSDWTGVGFNAMRMAMRIYEKYEKYFVEYVKI